MQELKIYTYELQNKETKIRVGVVAKDKETSKKYLYKSLYFNPPLLGIYKIEFVEERSMQPENTKITFCSSSELREIQPPDKVKISVIDENDRVICWRDDKECGSY